PCTISILSGLSGAPLAKQAHCVMVGGTRPTTRRVPSRRSPIDLASSPSPELPGSLSQHDVVPHMITRSPRGFGLDKPIDPMPYFPARHFGSKDIVQNSLIPP